MGCYGSKIAETPNIDRLAEEGMRFKQYYSASPVSSPSRCGLLTGTHPIKHKIKTFLDKRQMDANCEQEDFLKSSAPSMARPFHLAGYATAHIGKWHLGGGRDVDNAPSIKE